ncbi:ABC transporter ATP-binding protein [Bordetella sp. N]|nr:ABC transporter ATP-binding protein [Bordetella sp. N]
MLSVSGASVAYDALEVVHDVDLEVRAGEVVAVIGANGAGKTTLLSAIMGLLPLRKGAIVLRDERVDGLPTERRVARGISLVPEGRQIVPQLSVAENLIIGAYARRDKEVDQDRERIYERFPRLKERERQLAGLLSGGEQQMLAIGRALMARPAILLLDEPSMGLAPLIIEQIFDIISAIKAAGTTVLLVEQNARKALARADWAYVLEQGRVTLSDTAQRIAANPAVLTAYLGGKAAVIAQVGQAGP